MNRTTLIILVIAVLSGAFGFMSARHMNSTDPSPVETGVGHPLPALSGAALNFQGQDLAAFRGRVILLNFWATWCAPCRREMPDLQALHRDLDPERAVVVGVALDDPLGVQQFIEQLAIEYPILIPDEVKGTRMLRQLGNANGLMPFTVLVDAEGIVRDAHLGELSREQAAALIDQYL